MNKYTLKFHNLELETEYLKYFHQIQFKFLVTIILLTILQLVLRLIADYVYNFPQKMEMILIATGLQFVELLVVWKWKQFTTIGLYLNSIVIMVFQLTIQGHDGQLTFLLGENQMAAQCFVLFCMDNRDGQILNILACLFRILTAYILVENTVINFATYTYSVGAFLLISMCLYYKNLQMRQFYLKSLKNNIYEQIIPSLTKSPIFVFEYNDEKLSFQSKTIKLNGFLEHFEDPLHYFLRNTKIEDQSLEKYIFYQHVKKRDYSSGFKILELSVLFENSQPMRITLSRLDLENQIFIILVNSEIQDLKKLKVQYLRALNVLRQKIVELLLISSKLMCGSQSKEIGDQPIMKLISKYTWFLCNICRHNLRQEKVDLVKFTKRIRQRMNNKKRISIHSNQIIELKLIKQYLLIFFIELFSETTYNYLKVEFREIQGQIILQLTGLKLLPKSTQFNDVCNTLIKKKGYKNQIHTLIFNEETMVKFIKCMEN